MGVAVRVICCLLVALVPRPARAQEASKSTCDSSDTACTVGQHYGYTMAIDFPVVIDKPVPLSFLGGDTGVLNPIMEWASEVPEGYVIDYSGGLKLPPAPFVARESYENEDGDTAFVGFNVTILVNDTHFVPEHVSVLPGTTVTWDLQTWETVSVRSDDDGLAFNSGAINRNWSPQYAVTFKTEGVYGYHNAEVADWRNTFRGKIAVVAYNCSSYTLCSTCLAYIQCLWCPSNGTCIERDPQTNLPFDTGAVAKIDHVEGREFQSIRYMEGYNVKTARMEFNWFPWPPYRKNPRAVLPQLVPSYFDVTSSDTCSAYMRTRDASQCEDYVVPGLLNRVHGQETPNRPTLSDFFACYDHLAETWAKPELPTAKAWEAWPLPPPPPPPPPQQHDTRQEARAWKHLCCDICSSCNASLLAACNISCGFASTHATPLAASAVSHEIVGCPFTTSDISHTCTQYNSTSCEQLSSTLSHNSSRCEDLILGWPVMNASRYDDEHKRRRLHVKRPQHGTYETEREQGVAWDPASVLETSYKPLIEAAGPQMLPVEAQALQQNRVGIASVPRARRRAQFDGEDGPKSEWEQIPPKQRLFMPTITPEMDIWARLQYELERRFGPRCNQTHNCDDLRGTCLNISGLPIIGYDQNGTCHCHPWFTGATCDKMIIDEETCVGIPDLEQCFTIRNRLFLCGDVATHDALPPACENLSVEQCGLAGHMKGSLSNLGIENLLGRPDSGYATMTCTKCMARGNVRSETYGKLCDPAVVLNACQRFEDSTAQRLCNYCSRDTQGPVLPQRGEERSCSYYRGTCMGSVEKRIRGIVPPNMDIVGQTDFGGLRYCKQPTTFTSSKHYYTDADIMQVGQTCLDGTTPVYEGWDYSRQVDHPNTVRDGRGCQVQDGSCGLACLEPDNELTCPKARNCIDDTLCYSDTPDWKDIDELIRFWGLERLKRFADDPNCNVYISSKAAEEASLLLSNEDGSDSSVEQIPCTFNLHMATFDPQTAHEHANWPYLSDQYFQEFTKVSWGVSSQYAGPCLGDDCDAESGNARNRE